MKPTLPETEVIEVVMRKEMTLKSYMDLIKKTRGKGWTIQGCKLGRYSGSMNKKI